MLHNAFARSPAARKSHRLLLIVWIFVAIVVGLMAFAYYSFGLMSAARAYVGGEGLWSKAQKEAVLSLSRYVKDHRAEDYQAFQHALVVNLGDRQARLELEKSTPDLRIATEGFKLGRNHAEDIDGMINLYRNFRSVPELDRAITIWATADDYIAQLLVLGRSIESATQNGRLDDAVAQNFLAQLDGFNARLTPLEDEFSYSLGEISRKSVIVLRVVMMLVVTVLLLVAYLVSRRLVLQNERYQQALIASENQLRSLLQFAPLPIIIVGLPSNRVVYANERALVQFQLTMTELARQTAQDFYVNIEDRLSILQQLRTTGSVRDREVQLRDTNGKPFWVLLSSQRLLFEGSECLLTALNNIDERKRAQEELRHRAFHDELTGLPNRAMFMDAMSRALHRAERRKGSFSILFIDLDHFKTVNDELGHAMGDLLLQEVATSVRECVREGDLVARLGGDEFVILVEDDNPARVAVQIAKKLHGVLRPQRFLGGRAMHVTASIGISNYPEDGTSLDDLLRMADTAMYRVKETGRNSYQFHNTSGFDDPFQ